MIGHRVQLSSDEPPSRLHRFISPSGPNWPVRWAMTENPINPIEIHKGGATHFIFFEKLGGLAV